MEIEGRQTPHIFIFVDEAGFNLTKTRCWGRNVIGKRATVDVPGQRGANITICAAISTEGVLLHKPLIGPYNSEHLLLFLDELYWRVVPGEERDAVSRNQPTFIIVWDRTVVTEWFAAHPRMMSLFLPPYSPFLNPIEELFFSWRWKVYDHQPHDQMSLMDAMNAAYLDISAKDFQGWIRHARTFFPLCIALDDIRCDLDENLWPNAVHRVGYSFLSIAKMHCSILKPHFQNCSHIQRYRSLCGPNCESFCISFRQNACNYHIFQNPQTLLSFTLYNSKNTIHFEHIIQMLINCFQNW